MTTRERLRAHWQQGILTPGDQRILTVILLWQVLTRALDYLRGIGLSGPEFDLVETAFGAPRVGGALLVAVSLALGGMLFRWHLGVFLGHSLIAVIYLAIGVPILLSLEPSDAVRAPGIFLASAVFHGLIALRTGRRPLVAETAHPAGIITAPGGSE